MIHLKMRPDSTPTPATPAVWKAIVAEYQKPSTARALWQLISTLALYGGLWYAMFLLAPISIWLALPVAAVAGALVVRIFIVFHDCGHGSFFQSRLANDAVGLAAGLLTFTPYFHWRWEHSIHHSAAGDLSRRGRGDVWTLTVEEFLSASRWKRFTYRLARNPMVLFGFAPLFLFLVLNRLPSREAKLRERLSVHGMNLAILGMAWGLSVAFGLWTYILLQMIILLVATGAGVWLFYVQHQFEGVYWERGDDWDYTDAALKGSSYYKLPRVLQWFSGNIGFHHVHHLSPRIPNYNLERCHNSHPIFLEVKPITLRSSLKSLKFRLWDEERRQLVGFGYLKTLRRKHQPA